MTALLKPSVAGRRLRLRSKRSLRFAALVLFPCTSLLLNTLAADPTGESGRRDNDVAAATATPAPLASPVVAPPSTNAMEALDDKHKLAVGDRVSFRIEEDKEEPKQLVVTDSGELEVPYIGRVPAEAKTCKQLATELKTSLEKDYYYQATVIISVDQKAKSRGRVYIVGPVHTPGPQEIPSDETLTLSKAILRAGGFTDVADRHNVKLTRRSAASSNGKLIFVVDVAQIFDKGKVELDRELEPGDLILVPERLVRF